MVIECWDETYKGENSEGLPPAPGDQELINKLLSPNDHISEEEDVDNIPTLPIGSDRKVQISTYNVPYQRASTYELDAYKNRGTHQSTKHTMAIHEKYCQLIDRHIGKSTRSGTNKSPKVPQPRAYNGKEDTEVFEGWLKTS